MPPKQTIIREVPDRAFACKSARRRIKKKNLRNLVQLLLVTSELSAAAVTELADQELQRVRAARADALDSAPAVTFTDGGLAGEDVPSPIGTQPVVAIARVDSAPSTDPSRPILDLARETLRESREQSAAVRRLLSRSAELAPRRLPPPPAPVPVPVAGPQPASGSRTEARLVREYAKIRSAVAALEAAHLEHSSSPRPPPPTGGVTAVAPRDLAGLLLPDGTSVAHALAARDSRIAQLHFQITDRERRHRFASIDRAAAFVHNPANQLAAQPPSQPPLPSGREPVLPSVPQCGVSSPALPRALLPLRLPRVPRLDRRPHSSGARADPVPPAPVDRPGVAPVPPPLPGP
jgi:hypothetical protein